MSQTCKTCRHWTMPEEDHAAPGLILGKCAAVRMRHEIMDPARQIDDWDEREAKEAELLKAELAIAVDGSGYYAALNTQAEFGCVLHAPPQEGGE